MHWPIHSCKPYWWKQSFRVFGTGFDRPSAGLETAKHVFPGPDSMGFVWSGVGAHCADFGAFWRLFGPFLGHIVELKGTRGLLDMVKSSCTWSVATVSLRLGVLPGFWGSFARKMDPAPTPSLKSFKKWVSSGV